jgi:Spy/CpxP family protein refolding chaperone
MNQLLGLALLVALSTLSLPAFAGDAPDPAAIKAEMMEKMMPAMMEKNLPGMGMRHGAPTDARPCLDGPVPPCRQPLMGNGPGMRPHGMKPNRMEHDLYLDRAAELGLTETQMAKLKKIRSDCRKDNIRTGAELRIVRFDLEDLEENNAPAEQMEPLVRQSKTLEGDIELRHLKAKAAARQVLTAEQFKKAEAGDALEELF